MPITALQKRVLEISYKKKLAHVGSCVGAVGIIDEIYRARSENDPVIISAGHYGLALYIVLEKYLGKNAEELYDKHGTHPNRDEFDGIYCSTGSLGMGICVAVGMALADKSRNVWCLISDGEMAEGATMEALKFVSDRKLYNLYVDILDNGWSACRNTQTDMIVAQEFIQVHDCPTEKMEIPFLNGLDAHYHVMSDEDWQWVEKQEITE